MAVDKSNMNDALAVIQSHCFKKLTENEDGF